MDALKASLVGALLRLCSLLPLTLARALGRGVARIYWAAGGRARRVTECNIRAAFPQLSPAARADLAWRSLRATGELAAEAGRVWLRPWPDVRRSILSVQGAESIIEALAADRGVVVLAPHLGNWEVLGLHLATLGPTVSLYQAPRLAALAPLVARGRQGSGATLVPATRGGLAQLLRSLRGGGIAGILPDQVPADPGSGHNVPFMGVPCATATLAPRLLGATGALAVFGFAERVPGGFAVHYRAAEDAVYDRDAPAALAAINRGIEAALRGREEQYQWEYKRFREWPRRRPGLYDDV